MDVLRMIRHLATTPWRVRRAFPPSTLTAIENAIKHAEAGHNAELRFVVEGSLDPHALLHGQSPRQRAIDVFSLLRVWDTEHNNGVLIHVLLADHSVEIVADRGVHARVGEGEWARICRAMEAAFGKGTFEQGALLGIEAVGRCLVAQFPDSGHKPAHGELPDAPVIL